MKKTLLCGLLLLSGTAFAQKSDNVGIGTIKPDPSAILDLNSTSKGLLLPRMTQAQRDAIKNPAAGLVIFQTDTKIGTYTYDGTTWQPNAKIGSSESVLSSQTWNTQGNSIDGTDFIGSTNGQPLKFKVFGDPAGLIDYSTTNARLYLGYGSGSNNTGTNNTALGFQSLPNGTGSFNTAIGFRALSANTSGYSNLAIGNTALYKNQNGRGNMAIGGDALFNNVGGEFNSAIGVDALNSNISGNGNTAIGQGAGLSALGSYNVFIGNNAGGSETGGYKLYIANTATTTPLIGGDFANQYLKFHTGTSAPTGVAGFVAIGDFTSAGATNTPGTGAINTFPNFTAGSKYRLIVQDGILTEKLKVALRNGAEWADYVFAPDYKLMSLEEVEKFTLNNKHLPNVPSADDMAKNGLDVTQTSAKLMEKIEELTLYMIQMNKDIKALKAENEELKNKLK